MWYNIEGGKKWGAAPLNKINTLEKCKNFIINNIGFVKEDAQIMTECMWDAFKEDLSEV